MSFLVIILFSFLVEKTQNVITTSPIWITNPYFQTQSVDIKSNILTTFNATNPITKTFTFIKSYSQIPQLAYAIKNYRGNDRLRNEDFAIKRIGLSQIGFTINMLINGVTNIRILTIMYLSVDRSFPHHINVFNDINVNYGNGPLVNISTSTIGLRTYTNTINYTILANSIGSKYTTFGSNLNKNSIALYLSSIYNDAVPAIANGGVPKLIDFKVQTNILTIDTFQIKITVQDGYQITLITFGMVMMDVDDVQKSGMYTIVYSYTRFLATTNNFIPIPKQFMQGTFIGLVDFSATAAQCGLQFNFQLDPNNNQVIFNQSIPYSASSAICGLYAYDISILYVKTWQCPSTHTFFNITDSLCYQIICGDGYWLVSIEDCDDGNLINGDGCDNLCKVQNGFVCLIQDMLPSGISYCKYNKNITLQFSYYQKDSLSNSLHIYFTLQPGNLPEWNSTNINSLINTIQLTSQPNLNTSTTTPSIPLINYTIQYHPDSQKNQIQIILSYDNQSIQNTYLSFNIDPSNTNITKINQLPINKIQVYIVSDPQNVYYFYSYPNQMYQFKDFGVIKILSIIVSVISLLFILLGFFIPTGRLIIVEALVVVQIGYFSILQFNKVPPTFQQLKFLIYTSGYNDFSLFKRETQYIGNVDIYELMGLDRQFWMNYNISMVLFVLPVMIGLVGVLVTKIFNYKNVLGDNKNNKMKTINKQQHKQQLISINVNVNEQNKLPITIQTHTIKQRILLIKQLFLRLMLQCSFYGLITCGYLIFISIFYTIHSNNLTKQNIIMCVVFIIIWLVYVIMLSLDKSIMINLNQYLTRQQIKQFQSQKLQQLYGGFGQFRNVCYMVNLQKHEKYTHLQKVYLVFVIERIFTSIIIVYISQKTIYSPLVILVTFMLLLITLLVWNKQSLSLLPQNQQKSLFSFIYKNYTLRQSINFIFIIFIQLLYLTFQILRQTNGEQNVMTTNLFTTKVLPLLILVILIISLILNLIQWIWELKCSQILLKAKIILRVLSKNKQKQMKYQSNELQQDLIGNQSNKPVKKNCKNLNIKIETQQQNMNKQINHFISNNLIFQNNHSPFDGLAEKDSTLRPFFMPKMSPNIRKIEIQKTQKTTSQRFPVLTSYLCSIKNDSYDEI